ncbi:MAG: hypothetical protein ACI39U_00675, partial [Candidatus Cryptobacteroides sp.]
EGMSYGIRKCLGDFFEGAEVEVFSDMLGAARAVCGHSPGVVGILGTGSNSCVYDGDGIVIAGRGGGYVLGDEGSGAWFGKMLLSDYIRGLLPRELADGLEDGYGLDYQGIVNGVYGSGAPSAYLASFFPFVLGHQESPYVRNLLREGMEAYFNRVLAAFLLSWSACPFASAVRWQPCARCS